MAMSSSPLPAYAELHCLSNFSFQRGASHPEELVDRAIALGYDALALTDECSVSGMVRAHMQVKKHARSPEGDAPQSAGSPRTLQLLPGAEFRLGAVDAMEPAPRLVVLPHDLQGWGDLCECITAARARAPKGSYLLEWAHLATGTLRHCEVLLVLPRAWGVEALGACTLQAQALFGDRLWLALTLWRALDDGLWRDTLEGIAERTGVRLVAAGDVHMHARARKPLHDVLTAVGQGRSVADCGFALHPNAEAHLRRRVDLARIYPAPALQATLEVAARCSFSLDELRYQYPQETLLPGLTPSQTLRHHTLQGLQKRYPQGATPQIRAQVDHELALIAELGYEMYFLTVHDIVRFARDQGILCQGRGSAANSVVCFCLGVTEIDPLRVKVLFERFISRERCEPPDIDVDFEHQRREEVIQYIYTKYGRERAAITAVVTTYGRKSAIRDVGKALGFDDTLVDAFAREQRWFDERIVLAPQLAEQLQAAGIAAQDRRIHQWLDLTGQLLDFPRHLSQHVGGFVLTQQQLTRLVPVEPATMEKRSVIQWEKDDLDDVGMLKVDVLALGMLSALRRCRDFVRQWRGRPDFGIDARSMPDGDAATYDMLCRADTVGVFQIESRAQMSMLPRLKPREYYDLVVEVAIVRPGPIQGGMVHPYLKRRDARLRGEVWEWEHDPKLREALGRTLGVPIFQEQVMQIAILAADFTPDEADDLRRSMAAWKRKGGVHRFHDRLVGRMVAKGYPQEYAERVFDQMKGFGEYGFPESHAASFALLVYFSSWLKCHEPACFLAALLNAQPLGFYSPSQLVQDARRHGVEVRPVDVVHSDWDCTLEPMADSAEVADPAVRLGLRQVDSLGRAVVTRLVQARAQAPFADAEDLALRAGLDHGDMQALAAADALRSLAGHRRQQLWQAAALRTPPPLLRTAPVQESLLLLPPASEGSEVLADYHATGLTLRTHPVALLRPQLAGWRLSTAAELRGLPHGRAVRACGIVVTRQQPQTAKGVVFLTLEDETGSVNVIVWKSLREKQRAELLHARLLAVYGTWQRDVDSGGQVCHVLAGRLRDLTPLLGGLSTQSRDFH